MDVDHTDLILLNTVTISVLDGYSSWLSKRPPLKRPNTVVIFRLGAEEGLPGKFYPTLSKLIYLLSIRKLIGLLNRRLLLATDTMAIGAEFARFTFSQVKDIPLPISVPEATPPLVSPQVSVVFPSAAYAQKGFSLLPDALESAMRRCPSLGATIRVANAPEFMKPVVDRLQAMAPRVRLIHGALPEDRFYQMLSEADGVLLPYDPAVFRKRSSQILAEAAALGRPVIVIAGSFLDAECRAAGISAVTADAFTPVALEAALVRFAVERENLARAAWAACPRHRQRHSASTFVEQLLTFAQACAAAPTSSG
jgi:glycosyltransferase involved in cell wall biosynthesis